jgi:PKHD-type hydroxylase
MYLCIPNLLGEDQVAELSGLMERQAFADGRATGGLAAKEIKNNLQSPADTESYAGMRAIVLEAVNSNRQFSLVAIPRFFLPIRFARYTEGMNYGRHVDNAVMGNNPPIRIDMAFTVFLTRPDEYEGGELIVYEQASLNRFKLPKGSAVLYESNTLHEVAPVTAGRRDVAVGWLQSMIRNPVQRQIVCELEGLRTGMLAKEGRTPEFDTLSRNVAELWHMWVET